MKRNRVRSLENLNYKNHNLYYYEIKKASLALKSLSIYRNILKSNVLVSLQNLISYLEANTVKGSFDIGVFIDLYNKLYFELANSKKFNSASNDSTYDFLLKQYVVEYILSDENVFTKQAEKDTFGEINSLVKSAASNDLGYLQVICQLSCNKLKQYVLDLICPYCNTDCNNVNIKYSDTTNENCAEENPHCSVRSEEFAAEKVDNINDSGSIKDSGLSFKKAIIKNLPDWNITRDYHTGIYSEKNYYSEDIIYPEEDNKNRQSNFQGNNSLKESKGHYSNHFSTIIEKFLSEDDWTSLTEPLARFHNKWGYGDFARFRAFVWQHGANYRGINCDSTCSIGNLIKSSDAQCLNSTISTNGTNNAYKESYGYLKGIENPDPIKLTDLIGYEIQKNEVLNNTLLFLEGYPANNMLLYGDRGTGKSSTIKALVNEYYEQGLRIVEVPKKHIMDFPDIIRVLEGRKHKFIIFIDDLAFEDNEENYTALKAVLEGGVESKPSNIIIYATSNRRHLIKEKFSDRAGLASGNPDDEVHASDTIQEKLSLADRFGIKITFSAPDKNEFLKIVDGIAEKRGLKVDKEYLHREALKWELTYNGRSPRTAKQFVDWLEGYLKLRLR